MGPLIYASQLLLKSGCVDEVTILLFNRPLHSAIYTWWCLLDGSLGPLEPFEARISCRSWRESSWPLRTPCAASVAAEVVAGLLG